MLSQDDIKLVNSSLPFWSKLTKSQQDLVVNTSNLVSYSKGQNIHCGELECTGMLIIKSGTICTYITSNEGRQITLYSLSAGDVCVFSASCVLKSIDFDVSIDAQAPSEAIQINASTFSVLTSQNVYAELFSYKLATERFSNVMWAMQQVLFARVDQRLATFLIKQCNATNDFTIKITQEEIAHQINSAREVVARMLKQFANDGMVEVKRGHIVIKDMEKLKNLT